MMKNLILIIVLSAFALSATAQKEPIETANGFQIDIQTSAICEMCKEAIEKDLTFEKGVKSVNLNLDNKVVTVVYNGKRTDPNTIRKRITMVGYHADDMKRDSVAYENLPFCCKDGAHGTDPNHTGHQ